MANFFSRGFVGQLVGPFCLVGQLVGLFLLVGQLVGPFLLVGQLVGQFVGQLVGPIFSASVNSQVFLYFKMFVDINQLF